VRGETVWKIAEGFSTVRFCGKWRLIGSSSPPLGGLRRLHSGLIPIFKIIYRSYLEITSIVGTSAFPKATTLLLPVGDA
jgi:hypothetical protein